MSEGEGPSGSAESEETQKPFKALEAGFLVPEKMEMDFTISYTQEILANTEVENDEKWEMTIYPTINSLYAGLCERINLINTTMKTFEEDGMEATGLDVEELGEDPEKEFLENILTRAVLSEGVLTFFIVAQDAIETFSIKLLHDSLVVEPYENSNETIDMLDRYMSQPQRQRFLKRFELMNAPIVDKMDSVRDNRNNLVHDPATRDFYEFDDIMPKTDEVLAVLNEFYKLENSEPYWENIEEADGS
jgi:hypothetical protein